MSRASSLEYTMFWLEYREYCPLTKKLRAQDRAKNSRPCSYVPRPAFRHTGR